MLKEVISLVFPRICPACGNPISAQSETLICRECLNKCKLLTSPLCHVCGEPFTKTPAPDHLCDTCIREPFRFSKARSIFLYNGAVRKMIHKMKFHNDTHAAKILALLSAEHAQQMISNMPQPFQIIPIPLHRLRLMKRSFNQSKQTARTIFPGQSINNRLLTRTINTPSQRTLPRNKRFENVKNVFKVNITPDKDTTFILFDDVYTTGATVNSAATALIEAGAMDVQVITIARTPATT